MYICIDLYAKLNLQLYFTSKLPVFCFYSRNAENRVRRFFGGKNPTHFFRLSNACLSAKTINNPSIDYKKVLIILIISKLSFLWLFVHMATEKICLLNCNCSVHEKFLLSSDNMSDDLD